MGLILAVLLLANARTALANAASIEDSLTGNVMTSPSPALLAPISTAVLAIATSAFLAENPSYSDADPDARFPEREIGETLGLNELMRDVEDGRIRGDDAARLVFDTILPFGLIVGAEIGADPLRLPNLKGP